MTRRLLFAAWLSMASVAPADAGPADPPTTSQWFVVPAQPTTRTPITVRNITSGCLGATGARVVEIDHASGTIDFYLSDGSDICGPPVENHVTDTDLGYLPPRQYTLRFIGCTVPYDPAAPGCAEASWIPRITFAVAEAGIAHRTIPSMSTPVTLLLGGMLAAGALFSLRRRT